MEKRNVNSIFEKTGDLKISGTMNQNTSGITARSTGDHAGVLEEVWRNLSVGL